MATLIESAQSDGRFSTLLQAVRAADLESALSGEGPLTLFAPTDDAFAQLDDDLLNSLLSDKDKLTRLLTYHVAGGRYTAADLEGLSRLTTLQGNDLQVTVDDSSVHVDEATVTQSDMGADNGVIHVLDQVILPESVALS